MKAVTDHEGKIAIDLRRGDTSVSFKIGGMDGVPFAPHREVEIDDERLGAVIDQLAAPFGLGRADRVWGALCP